MICLRKCLDFDVCLKCILLLTFVVYVNLDLNKIRGQSSGCYCVSGYCGYSLCNLPNHANSG